MAMRGTIGKFRVVQFFDNGEFEVVREGVSDEEAVSAAHHYSHSVGAKLGMTQRVIIESYDPIENETFCNFEWEYGKGVTFK